MPIPSKYAWLGEIEGLPLMVAKGLELFGLKEAPGSVNNATIMGWARETGLQSVYTADSIPWCGLFMAVVAKRANKSYPSTPLWALSWSKFGVEAGQPRLGDVLTFTRDGGGHVGLYIAEDRAGFFHVLGGNQSDSVSIARIAKSRLHRVRRPAYVNMPAGAKPYIVEASGTVTTNER